MDDARLLPPPLSASATHLSRLTWLLLHACARPIEAGREWLPTRHRTGSPQARLIPGWEGRGEEPMPAWENPK